MCCCACNVFVKVQVEPRPIPCTSRSGSRSRYRSLGGFDKRVSTRELGPTISGGQLRAAIRSDSRFGHHLRRWAGVVGHQCTAGCTTPASRIKWLHLQRCAGFWPVICSGNSSTWPAAAVCDFVRSPARAARAASAIPASRLAASISAKHVGRTLADKQFFQAHHHARQPGLCGVNATPRRTTAQSPHRPC